MSWGLLPAMGWSLQEFARHERRAWARLRGCKAPPVDPYTDTFVDSLFPPSTQRSARAADVLHAYRHTVQHGPPGRQRSACADLLIVSVHGGEIAAASCANVSKGALTSFHEFKFILANAVQLAPHVDALFLLDLGAEPPPLAPPSPLTTRRPRRRPRGRWHLLAGGPPWGEHGAAAAPSA